MEAAIRKTLKSILCKVEKITPKMSCSSFSPHYIIPRVVSGKLHTLIHEHNSSKYYTAICIIRLIYYSTHKWRMLSYFFVCFSLFSVLVFQRNLRERKEWINSLNTFWIWNMSFCIDICEGVWLPVFPSNLLTVWSCQFIIIIFFLLPHN